MSLWSVERDGVKVGEFFARPIDVERRVIEVCMRNNPQPTTKWDLWQEPRQFTTKTTLHTYQVVHNKEYDSYSTYMGTTELQNSPKTE